MYFQTELSNLEAYWTGRNVVSITEELNRHFNELDDSNSILNNLNKDVADLYSIFTNTKQRQVIVERRGGGEVGLK